MKRTLQAVLVLAAALAAFVVYTGYIGGRVFTDLPPKAAPVPALRGVGAVLVSGDMGFSVGMGRDVCARLRRDGIPVLAVNSLAFFRHRRTPAEDRALIASAIRRALGVPGTRKVVLIGQSFGADMLQVGLAGLEPALRPRVMSVALIVPEQTVEYRASPSDLLDVGEPLVAALPTARRLDWVPTLCVQGREETDSLCPLLSSPNVRRVALPGGHPLRRDSDLVYGVLLGSVVQAAAGHARAPSLS